MAVAYPQLGNSLRFWATGPEYRLVTPIAGVTGVPSTPVR